MRSLRHWSVRHARGLRRVYDSFARLAPLFAPLVRLLGPSRSEALLNPLERGAKQLMFDCQMCGQCVLSSTGLACPMNCAKQMRNGPCGGVRADGGCEVKPEMRCVWVEATEGDQRIVGKAGKMPAHLLPPLDHAREGKSSWVPVILGDGDFGKHWKVPASEPVVVHEAAPFELACNSGRFVVTVEVAPPDSADPSVLIERARRFEGLVDAITSPTARAAIAICPVWRPRPCWPRMA
jgi:methylenetetrahydrofolate reductase (NADPH)